MIDPAVKREAIDSLTSALRISQSDPVKIHISRAEARAAVTALAEYAEEEHASRPCGRDYPKHSSHLWLTGRVAYRCPGYVEESVGE